MKKIIVLLLLTLVIIPNLSKGTCIIILKKNNIIYIAADSRTLITNLASKKKDTTLGSICKIHNFGNVYFAVAGFGDEQLATIANACLKETKSLDKAIEYFGRAMCLVYNQNLVLELKANYPKDYAYYKKNIMSGVSFMGFNNGKAFVKEIIFSMVNSEYVTSKVSEQESIVPMGIYDHLNTVAAANLFDKSQSPIKVVENIVKYEMKFHKREIGGDIALLELRADGPHWKSKANCH